MEIRRVKIGEIKPYENNPRLNDGAVDAVAESIRQCGYCAPIVVDENMVILAGHTRHKALQKLGYDECEVCIVRGLSEEQKKKYRILDNKTNELAKWDFTLLEQELEGLEFEGFDFDLKIESKKNGDWFSERKRYEDDSGEDDEYQDFVDKFKPKKTTDDCYTPDNIFEAVVGWVSKEYGVQAEQIVRPFYPGGDYVRHNYPEGCVVVDNPPFSILAEIIRFYCKNGIKFFLFGPTLTIFSGRDQDVTWIPVGVGVTYENGACVNTSFITNMDSCMVRTAPELYKTIEAANDENLKSMHKELPKYSYPDHVLTSAIAARWSKYGVDFRLDKKDGVFIAALDEQKECDKAVFGGGVLMSDKAAEKKAAAEKAAAEKAAAQKWKLSEREWAIVRTLG